MQEEQPNQPLKQKRTINLGMENLKKWQKILIVILVLVILTMAGYILYLKVFSQDSNNLAPNSYTQPISIKNLNCDEAKDTLSDIYAKPETVQTLSDVTLVDLEENTITIKLPNQRQIIYKLNNATQYEKIVVLNNGSSVKPGSKEELTTGMTIPTLQVNVLDEVKYVSYLATQ